MIEQAWDEYRGWAKRARSLQTQAERWNVASLAALIVTGVLGSAAAFFATRGDPNADLARALACAAAVASALSLYVGRQALAVGAESGWLRARATAEAIKSECFRFAAGLGDYAPEKSSDAAGVAAFIDRRQAIAARAAGDSLTPEDDPVGADGDDRRPSRPMTEAWYLAKRIDEQIDYYRKGQEQNERAGERLQRRTFAAGALVAAVSAAAAFYGAFFTAWIGALTTIGAAVSAYGLAERQKYLAASYAAMKANLLRLKERYEASGIGLEALVTAAEDLMVSEHAAWIDRMTKTIPVPPEPSPAGGRTAATAGE